MKSILIIFVKAPRPSQVKTRLAAAIGTDAACDAYRALVDALRQNLLDLSRVQLRFSPDHAADEIRGWLRGGWTLRPQGEGDLGSRLTAAFADAFASGSTPVAVIGSDCPYVTTKDIRAGWAATKQHDVVLGPATDGGYWMIALREPQPELFRDISWSSSDVLGQTVARARELDLRVHLLRELEDVDTEATWQRFNDWIKGRKRGVSKITRSDRIR